MGEEERRELHPDTRAAHGGPVRRPHGGPMVPPIYQTSIHAFATSADLEREGVAPGGTGLYTRLGNPTIAACEAALADLEGADGALCFASGMAAISTTLLALVSTGDRVVMLRDQYGGTTQLMRTVLDRFGVTLDLIDVGDGLDGIATACAEPTRLLFCESPTNPNNGIVDLRGAARVAHDAGALAVIDNTVATPLGQQPLAAGFDVVCHSASKGLSGHSDVIAGVVAARAELLEPIVAARTFLGGVIDPHAAFLLQRGLRTLALRVERACASAQQVAEFLDQHARVRVVNYCGLPHHPGHAIAAGQMRHFGSLFAFEVDGDGAAARRVVDALQVFAIAGSLGGVESLAVLPAVTSHAGLTAEDRAAIGVHEPTIRLSIGIEAAEDLIADLERALALR